MNYQSIVEEINSIQGKNCFRVAEVSSIEYLETLRLSEEVLAFYRKHEPADIIEINEVRLLPISEIIEENDNYTPGYLLSPHGYCAIASTIYGDIYCIKTSEGEDQIVLASHDEISKGQELNELTQKVKIIGKSFYEFLDAFKGKRLVKSYYDIE